MMVVTIRTDKPEAELGLYKDGVKLAYLVWPAHTELSATLHHKLQDLLVSQDKALQDVEGIICFKGPGSFTGLRIGLTVGNALAYGLGIPIVASGGQDWIEVGNDRLARGEQDDLALPEYGSPAHVTLPKR